MMSWVGPDGIVYHSHDGLAPHLMNPFTLLATSAEELHQSSLGISMKELSLLVSVALVVLGRFLLFFFKFIFPCASYCNATDGIISIILLLVSIYKLLMLLVDIPLLSLYSLNQCIVFLIFRF